MKLFAAKYRDFLLVIVIWIATSLFLGVNIAVVIAIITFMLLLRTEDYTKVFFALLTILILSDTRTYSIAFGANAKIGFILLLAAFMFLKRDDFKFSENKVVKSFLPFFIFVGITIPFAHDVFGAFQKAFSYFLMFLLVPPLLQKAKAQNQHFNSDIIHYFFLTLIIGLVAYVILPDYATLIGRFRGVLGNPNGLGIYMTLLFPIFYHAKESLSEKGNSRSLNLLFYGVFATSLILTQSRTALFAILIFMLFSNVRALRGGIGLLVFGLILASYQLIIANLPLIISSLGLTEYFRIETLMEGSGRFIAWDFAWQQIQTHFFVGGGFDFTNQIFHENYSYLSQLGHQGNAHNSYLTLWLDNGIIGLMLFLGGLIHLLITSASQNPLTLPMAYAVLFSTNFESWLTASLNPFTILFITFFALGFIKNNDSLESSVNSNGLLKKLHA